MPVLAASLEAVLAAAGSSWRWMMNCPHVSAFDDGKGGGRNTEPRE